MEGPVGVAQHLASHDNCVGLIRGEDLLGLNRLCDKTYSARGDTHLTTNGCGKGSLVPGPHRNHHIRDEAPARAINQVYSNALEPPAEINGLAEVPPAFCPVRAGD